MWYNSVSFPSGGRGKIINGVIGIFIRNQDEARWISANGIGECVLLRVYFLLFFLKGMADVE